MTVPASADASNYRTLWRWHFYAALFVMPFLIALALTGTIYVFKPQIESALYGDKLFVAASTHNTLDYDRQLLMAAGAVPKQAVATSISIGSNPQRSTEVVFRQASGESTSVYVDPANGPVVGSLSVEHRLLNQMRQIHRNLMRGKCGAWLMELAACWTLIMLVTGIAMWWPNGDFSVRGTLLPRLRLQGRAVWRE